jgi:hypothetical protein
MPRLVRLSQIGEHRIHDLGLYRDDDDVCSFNYGAVLGVNGDPELLLDGGAPLVRYVACAHPIGGHEVGLEQASEQRARHVARPNET